LAHTLWQDDEQGHGPLILLVIIWLFWEQRGVLIKPAEGTAPFAGYMLLVFGLLVYAVGRSQDITLLETGSLAPVLAGTLLVSRGWAGIRFLWFPLLFIVFLLPLPGMVIDAITLPLKQAVSDIVERLLYFAGFPIARNGVVLMIGQYQLLVADACSGLNSMFSLSALGVLYLYLMRSPSLLHNAMLIASILPIAFIANIIRVIVLVLLTYYLGDEAGQGFLHEFSGMMLFIIALSGLFLFDRVLRFAGALIPGMQKP
jgi:exosortase B